MSRLHIFDMDGTLLRGSACLEVSRHMGKLDAVNVMEEAWVRGEVGHVEFYRLLLPLWEGLTDADIDEVFAATAWMNGVAAVWADIAERGEHSAVITLSPQFFVKRLLRWGVGSAHGAEVEAGFAPNPELVLTPESKVTVARGLMARYGLGRQDCVVYGDSASDVPLFRAFPYSVSVNGSDALRAMAAVAYVGDDLRGAYAAGRSLLDHPARAVG